MKYSMEQLIPYSTIWEKNIATILHIYGDRSILFLLCNYKDTESESPEMEIAVAVPILTQKISKAPRNNDIHTQENGGNNCGNY